MEKTNVMRLLDVADILYEAYEYNPETTDGMLVAKALNEDPNEVFKTLVTVAPSKNHYVFVIPVNCSLNLKKAAKSVGEKSIEMIKQKELLPLTGYIHGGCSPIGMKKPFTTVINEPAQLFDAICVSAGKVGKQIKIYPFILAEYVSAKFYDLTD